MDTYPAVVHAALREMSEEDRLTFEAEYQSRKKGVVPMLVATFCLVHFFFYGRVGLGLAFLVSIPLAFGVVWWVVEMFMVGYRVRAHNEALATSLARDMRIMAR